MMKMKDTPMASSKLLNKPKEEIKWEEFKPNKRPNKAKKESVRWRR